MQPTPMQVFQNIDDQKIFGNLLNVGVSNSVHVFRPPSDKSPRTIPALRVTIQNDEYFPLAAISYGKGYLIVSGMSVQSNVEFSKIVTAIENFIQYIQRMK